MMHVHVASGSRKLMHMRYNGWPRKALNLKPFCINLIQSELCQTVFHQVPQPIALELSKMPIGPDFPGVAVVTGAASGMSESLFSLPPRH